MRVYSYLRFSAAKQALGSSLDRQAEYARKWAESHGHVFDDTLTMRDEGLSAYHQKHIKTGALGVFLDAVTEGRIPPGSILIVEGLDRLSRAEPMLAQAQLSQIISANITVVTAADGKSYSRESMKATPMDLIYSLLVMIRAHEESETKSKRVSAACRRKCEAWVAGTFRGRISVGRDPSWVCWDGNKFDLHPTVAPSVKAAVAMYIAGYGPIKILQDLADAGMSITSSHCASNLDHLITKQPSLFIGTRPLKAQGVPFVLEGYYPALLTQTEYAALLAAIKARTLRPRAAGGKGAIPSLFRGSGVLSCGHCGLHVVSNNITRVFSGRESVYRRMRCPTCELASSKLRNKLHRGSCPAMPVERAILDYCADQFNLDSLLAGGDTSDAIRAEIAATQLSIEDLTRRTDKLLDAALDDEAAMPQAVITRLRDLEKQVEHARDKEQRLLVELRVSSGVVAGASADHWKKIKTGVLNLDYDARIRCRRLLADTFTSIGVFFRGRLGTPEDAIDLLLVSKVGVARWLQIDRKTGDLLSGTEVTLPPSAQ